MSVIIQMGRKLCVQENFLVGLLILIILPVK